MGIRQQSHIGKTQRGVHAEYLGVGFGIDEAGITVTRIAADALAGMKILLIALQAEGSMKWFQSKPFEIVAQLLDARLVADGRVRIRPASARIRRIFTSLPVDVIEPFRFQVVRFELIVRDGPGRRDSAEMANLSEIFFAEAEECGTVKFGIAADVVVGVRMERLAVFVAPIFLGLVLAF